MKFKKGDIIKNKSIIGIVSEVFSDKSKILDINGNEKIFLNSSLEILDNIKESDKQKYYALLKKPISSKENNYDIEIKKYIEDVTKNINETQFRNIPSSIFNKVLEIIGKHPGETYKPSYSKKNKEVIGIIVYKKIGNNRKKKCFYLHFYNNRIAIEISKEFYIEDYKDLFPLTKTHYGNTCRGEIFYSDTTQEKIDKYLEIIDNVAKLE